MRAANNTSPPSTYQNPGSGTATADVDFGFDVSTAEPVAGFDGFVEQGGQFHGERLESGGSSSFDVSSYRIEARVFGVDFLGCRPDVASPRDSEGGSGTGPEVGDGVVDGSDEPVFGLLRLAVVSVEGCGDVASWFVDGITHRYA